MTRRKWSASAIYTRPLGDAGWWSTTAGLGPPQRRHDASTPGCWRARQAERRLDLFARAERTENDELAAGPPRTVSRLSAGAIHDWRLGEQVRLGVGVLGEPGRVPAALKASYGGQPRGAMVFVRLKVG